MNAPIDISAMSPNHAAYFTNALKRIPWATQTNAKRYESELTPSRPPFLKRAKGCRVWDLDGKEYIDFKASLGPIILGHQYPEVDDAVKAQLQDGVLFSMASPLELEAAEAILDTLGWADKIRFMKTGADVCASCLRLARSKTKRHHFLTSGYHGYQDWFALGWPNNGIPSDLQKFSHAIEYGDLEAVDQIFAAVGQDLAAVIVSPVEWHKEPSKAFLEKLRHKCNEYGSVLIFDEVLTGFRLAKGGASEYFGIVPDLAAYAKGIANGYPLSAYAGKAEFMNVLDSSIITTTYAGECLSLAAAKATMDVFQREPVFHHLAALGQKLRDGFDSIFKEFSYPAKTVGLAPAVTIQFGGNEAEQSTARIKLFEQLFQRGIFANKEWFITYSHRESDITETLEKFRESVKAIS
ncbi:aminotransferase class III-fold pyridoxal phosphate-dependent enzyme [Pelagicoccus sp. SDUM812002]|uniref:aspartate aminotransferase family protein n=1 Tax=Pelagicoccus sp. SDUM812002 TaxID=3041266 RepID=UPI00280CE543|nr:aminotransferase class III-fold pyridoxal phosphate-dependent enzyme [Pelagicoccus sp. SDUM812002]MDQ8187705.1 aminotransferase class III-fold pyridoxal phosphate-dependent enzyme [Pelagicoccus sp. SDUM812002]